MPSGAVLSNESRHISKSCRISYYQLLSDARTQHLHGEERVVPRVLCGELFQLPHRIDAPAASPATLRLRCCCFRRPRCCHLALE